MRRFAIFIYLSLVVYLFSIGVKMPQAQPYPSRPIQIVVPNDPGSAGDTAARSVTDELSKILKTPVIVVAKPGASSTLGTDFVAKSKRDGYTIVYANTSAVVYARATNPEIVPYDPARDLEPLGLHCFFPLAVAVQENSPWKTFKELVDYAKKNPGSIRFGLHGQGTIDHFDLEIIKSLAAAEFIIVPFKGAAATTTALLGGHVDAIVVSNGLVRPHAQAGKVRMLLVTSKMRDFPDVPTTTELGYDQSLPSAWFAWFGPAGLSEEVKRVLIPALEKTAKNHELEQKLEKLGLVVDYKPPQELMKIMMSDYETARALAIRLGLGK